MRLGWPVSTAEQRIIAVAAFQQQDPTALCQLALAAWLMRALSIAGGSALAIISNGKLSLRHSFQGHAVHFAGGVQRHLVEDDDLLWRFVADAVTRKAD